MIISEQEKQDILSKYSGNTSDQVLTYLKRNFPVYERTFEFFDAPVKFIMIEDKIKYLKGNKKYLVGLLSSYAEEVFPLLETAIIRRTVKKYIDVISVT